MPVIPRRHVRHELLHQPYLREHVDGELLARVRGWLGEQRARESDAGVVDEYCGRAVDAADRGCDAGDEGVGGYVDGVVVECGVGWVIS